jgi:signal transduction histidine kinase
MDYLKLNQGTLSAESEADKGSTFTVGLPLNPK